MKTILILGIASILIMSMLSFASAETFELADGVATIGEDVSSDQLLLDGFSSNIFLDNGLDTPVSTSYYSDLNDNRYFKTFTTLYLDNKLSSVYSDINVYKDSLYVLFEKYDLLFLNYKFISSDKSSKKENKQKQMTMITTQYILDKGDKK